MNSVMNEDFPITLLPAALLKLLPAAARTSHLSFPPPLTGGGKVLQEAQDERYLMISNTNSHSNKDF